MAVAPQFVSTPNTAFTKFANADGTTKKTVFTAGSNGSRLEALSIASNDTTANVAIIYVSNGGTDYQLVGVSIAVVGNTVVLNVNALANLGWTTTMDGGIVLKNGDSIKVSMNAAVTSGKEVDVHAIGGDF